MDIKYLRSFPFEVLEHICSYLNTVDIIKLSELLAEFDEVSCSKRVIQKINLYNEYYITKNHITTFLTTRPRCDFLTSLNLNCLYWIPAADIRKCISLLQNLECLYVVDTKLGLTKQDLSTYNKVAKLRKLGTSVTKRTFCKDTLKYFPKLTHFYLHLDSDADAIVKHVMFVLKKHKHVEEIWLIESATLSVTPLSLLLSHITIPNSAIKFNCLLHNIYFFNEELSQMQRIYRSTFGRMITCWEKRDHPVKALRNLEFSKEWNTFLDLSRTHDPFTPEQTKEILERESLDNIKFDEINLAHDTNVCGETQRTVTEKLVLYDSMRSLKKLALGFCACISDGVTDETPSNTKRKKQDNTCLLNRISENSPDINVLEIWHCLRADGCSRISNDSCNAIASFKYLQKLTLDNLPIHINGSFLNNVFISCKHLSSLRISSKQQNSPLHNFLCISLKYAVALKDLRYEHPCNISIDRLLLALSQNKNLSIERVFIKCKGVEIFSAKPIQNFLDESVNLRLFCLVINDLPKTVIKQTMKALEKYNDDPRKVLLITNNEYSYNGRIQIPFIHIYEMMMCLTHVAVLDVFNGYT